MGLRNPRARRAYQRDHYRRAAQRARKTAYMRAWRRQKREAIYARDGWRCHYCGAHRDEGARLTLDHRVARWRGGADDAENLLTACFGCNRRKGSMPYVDFLLVYFPEREPAWVTEGVGAA